ncbi:hypothetical protein [Xanthobacter flavus]|uniref:hypothetical protein n=1 Tax=Xanthobacter flavus TaxID=281 RepID=UPI0037299C20
MRNHLLSNGLFPRSRTRPLLMAGLAAVAFVPIVLAAGVSPASAQTTVAVPGGYVTFTPVQRRYIETYVVRHPVPPAYIPGGFVAEVGAVVPPDVDLRRFGDAPEPYGRYGQAVAQPGYGQPGYEPDFDDDDGYQTLDEAGYAPGAGLSQYRYVTLPGNEAAVVEPRSRRIILIVE